MDPYLVAWEDYRGREGNVVATRVDPAGHVLDLEPLTLPRLAADITEQVEPRVVFDGQEYVVSWIERTGNSGFAHVLGIRIAPDGTLTSEPFAISDTEREISAHALAAGATVNAFWEIPIQCRIPTIRGVTLEPNGGILGSSLMEYTAPSSLFSDILVGASGDSELLILSPWDGNHHGFLLDRSTVTPLDTMADMPGVYSFSSVIGVPGSYVLASNYFPYVFRYDPVSRVATSPRERNAIGASPAVAYDGQRLFAVSPTPSTGGARLTIVDGAMTSTGPTVTIQGDVRGAVVSSRTTGEALLVYQTHDLAMDAERIRIRVLGVSTLPDDGGVLVDASHDAEPDVSTDVRDSGTEEETPGDDGPHDSGFHPRDADAELPEADVSESDAEDATRIDAAREAGAGRLHNDGSGISEAGEAATAISEAGEASTSRDLNTKGVSGGGCGCRSAPTPAHGTSQWLFIFAVSVSSLRRRPAERIATMRS